MASRSKRTVEAALAQKGFRQHEGDHHFFVFWTADERKTAVRTKTSHGSTKDLGDGLLLQMARQVKLTKSEFLELVDCPMSRDQYEKHLDDAGHI